MPPLEFNGVGSGNDPGGVSVLVGHFQRSGLFELSLNLGAIAFGGRRWGHPKRMMGIMGLVMED